MEGSVSPDSAGQAASGQEAHGGNTVRVTINKDPKDIHRGSYTTEALKTALSVDPSLDLDIVEDGVFRTLADNDRLVVREGMEFISHVRQGGSS